MKRLSNAVASAGLVVALLCTAACGDDDELTSDERRQASDAALEDVGEGRVTEVEKGDGDDPYAYEVEVTLDNGNDVTVQLDDDFAVLNPSR
ncbi:PepSY domain-containing protein [Nocardioides pantholopis]|uniref:PepSY domain-containing protein n=1 Tax=Nocardioides pantholopis TaxID=2483798 RepID=UPI000F084E83|nr:PepSY domain-containing protein [Nocardioides pantholopis]